MNAFHWTKSREEMELILLNLDLLLPPWIWLEMGRFGRGAMRGRKRRPSASSVQANRGREGREGKSWPGFKSQGTAPC